RRRHTRSKRDWSSDVCSSDLLGGRARLSLPIPLGNVIGGGRHAVGGTTIQEYLVASQGPTVSANVFTNARVHGLVRDALEKKLRSEERRVGKECETRGASEH